MSGSPFPIRRRETTNVPLEQRRVRCSTSQEGSPPRVQAVWGRRSRRRKGRAPLTEGSRQSAEQGHSVPYGTPVMTVIVTLCPCGPPPPATSASPAGRPCLWSPSGLWIPGWSQHSSSTAPTAEPFSTQTRGAWVDVGSPRPRAPAPAPNQALSGATTSEALPTYEGLWV